MSNSAHPYIKSERLAAFLAPKPIVFIVNPNSGTHLQDRLKECLERFLNHQKFEYSIWYTTHPGHATELARKAVAEGFEYVIAVGGDGSVNEVAAGLLGSEAILGIIPAGSGNGLAMHLGYGRVIEHAVKKLNSAEPQLIDCGLCNERPFFNVAGVGFDGFVSNRMNNLRRRGFLPYLLTSLQAGLEYSPKLCRIEANGEIITERCFAISVANGPMYGYNVQIAPGAKLDDGQFLVVLLKDAPKWQYFAAVPSTLNGKILEEPFVQYFSTNHLTISSDGNNHVHIDGEGFKVDDPLRFSIRPQALKVLVPKR
jgi:diacylglycerol kinase (ATP)